MQKMRWKGEGEVIHMLRSISYRGQTRGMKGSFSRSDEKCRSAAASFSVSCA